MKPIYYLHKLFGTSSIMHFMYITDVSNQEFKNPYLLLYIEMIDAVVFYEFFWNLPNVINCLSSSAILQINLYFLLVHYIHDDIKTSKNNATCFYTPVVLKLSIIVKIWKKHKGENLENFDTPFVTTDQVLIILWHLKGSKYTFPLLQ